MSVCAAVSRTNYLSLFVPEKNGRLQNFSAADDLSPSPATKKTKKNAHRTPHTTDTPHRTCPEEGRTSRRASSTTAGHTAFTGLCECVGLTTVPKMSKNKCRRKKSVGLF